ncbi:MAG: ABC transporter ATP-binding protein [Candidatus Brockarchaeota archaeon]|nr:ABC transporter ATP-binding protein [Candidatus Brockarchaeota archaeon]
MSQPMIETRELSKYYGEIKAVDRLNLTVYEGEIFGLLGPNGSGKTTTFITLMGLTVPTSGTATIGGYDIVKDSRKVRKIASMLPEGAGYYEDLTAEQNLNYICQLNDIPKPERERTIKDLLEAVGLADNAKMKVEKFSRGMRQRLGIAEVLIKKPRVALFDEPTIGLDPQGTKEIRDMMFRLNKEQGLTVLLSSHLLYEVQQTCQRVGIIRKGRLIAADTIGNLSKKLSKWKVTLELELAGAGPDLIREIKGINDVMSVDQEGSKIFVHMESDRTREVSEAVIKHGATILLMRPKEHSLDEIFMEYMKEGDQ